LVYRFPGIGEEIQKKKIRGGRGSGRVSLVEEGITNDGERVTNQPQLIEPV
jgi:hypothetical protein